MFQCISYFIIFFSILLYYPIIQEPSYISIPPPIPPSLPPPIISFHPSTENMSKKQQDQIKKKEKAFLNPPRSGPHRAHPPSPQTLGSGWAGTALGGNRRLGVAQVIVHYPRLPRLPRLPPGPILRSTFLTY